MNKPRNLLLNALFAGLLLFIACGPKPALAFSPPNDRLYPPTSYKSAVVESIKATKVATYEVVDQYGWASWHAVVSQALDTGSPYEYSLGNILSAAVPAFSIREARPGETPTMRQYAVSASAQMTFCNDPSGWSVACAFLLNPLPAPTYYKASTMQLYPFVSQAAVVEHETFHHVARACDQYLGGCPPTNTQGFQCTGNPDTLMDCSLGSTQLSARWAQPFDVDTFLLATGFQRGQGAQEPPYVGCTTYPGWEPSVSCYWTALGKWLWGIDAAGHFQVWEWSVDRPKWSCASGCPQ